MLLVPIHKGTHIINSELNNIAWVNRNIGSKTKESQVNVIVNFTFAIGQVIIISQEAMVQQLKNLKLILEILIKRN